MEILTRTALPSLGRSKSDRLLAASFEGRLLILSSFSYTNRSRPTPEISSKRNRFLLRYSADHYAPHIAEGSSLAADLASLPR